MVAFIMTIIETSLLIGGMAWVWYSYSAVNNLKDATVSFTDAVSNLGKNNLTGEPEAEVDVTGLFGLAAG